MSFDHISDSLTHFHTHTLVNSLWSLSLSLSLSHTHTHTERERERDTDTQHITLLLSSPLCSLLSLSHAHTTYLFASLLSLLSLFSISQIYRHIQTHMQIHNMSLCSLPHFKHKSILKPTVTMSQSLWQTHTSLSSLTQHHTLSHTYTYQSLSTALRLVLPEPL